MGLHKTLRLTISELHACSFSFTLFSAHPLCALFVPPPSAASPPPSLPARVWCNPLQRAVNPCLHKLYLSILRLDGAAASTFTVGSSLDDIKPAPAALWCSRPQRTWDELRWNYFWLPPLKLVHWRQQGGRPPSRIAGEKQRRGLSLSILLLLFVPRKSINIYQIVIQHLVT